MSLTTEEAKFVQENIREAKEEIESYYVHHQNCPMRQNVFNKLNHTERFIEEHNK